MATHMATQTSPDLPPPIQVIQPQVRPHLRGGISAGTIIVDGTPRSVTVYLLDKDGHIIEAPDDRLDQNLKKRIRILATLSIEHFGDMITSQAAEPHSLSRDNSGEPRLWSTHIGTNLEGTYYLEEIEIPTGDQTSYNGKQEWSEIEDLILRLYNFSIGAHSAVIAIDPGEDEEVTMEVTNRHDVRNFGAAAASPRQLPTGTGARRRRNKEDDEVSSDLIDSSALPDRLRDPRQRVGSYLQQEVIHERPADNSRTPTVDTRRANLLNMNLDSVEGRKAVTRYLQRPDQRAPTDAEIDAEIKRLQAEQNRR